MSRGRTSLVPLALVATAIAACGHQPPPAATPVQHETAEDSILRVGHVWRSISRDRGLRSPPSKISVFETITTSTITLDAGKQSATEQLVLEEMFELRNGARFQCVARGKLRVRVRFGRLQGEAAVEVTRPPTSLPRHCQPADFGEPELAVDAGSARFALRGDQLVAFAPPLDKRVYLPAD